MDLKWREANCAAAKAKRCITLSQSYTWSGCVTFTRCVLQARLCHSLNWKRLQGRSIGATLNVGGKLGLHKYKSSI